MHITHVLYNVNGGFGRLGGRLLHTEALHAKSQPVASWLLAPLAYDSCASIQHVWMSG